MRQISQYVTAWRVFNALEILPKCHDYLNHRHNQQSHQLWLSRWFLLLALLLLLLLQLSPAYAQTQCFIDAQAAYTHLLQQEKVQKQSQKTTSQMININDATEAELIQLKGIGSHKAQAIIAYREGFGDFQQVDELTKVKGIGQKTVDKNRHQLVVK